MRRSNPSMSICISLSTDTLETGRRSTRPLSRAFVERPPIFAQGTAEGGEGAGSCPPALVASLPVTVEHLPLLRTSRSAALSSRALFWSGARSRSIETFNCAADSVTVGVGGDTVACGEVPGRSGSGGGVTLWRCGCGGGEAPRRCGCGGGEAPRCSTCPSWRVGAVCTSWCWCGGCAGETAGARRVVEGPLSTVVFVDVSLPRSVCLA